jgi:hypothetical protein
MPLNSADRRGSPRGRKSSSKHSQGLPEAGLLPGGRGRSPRLQAGEHVTGFTYEIALCGAPDQAAVLHRRLATGLREAAAGLTGLLGVDVYTPFDGPARDPYNHDSGGPLMMLMLDFATRDALAAAVTGGPLPAPFAPAGGVTATGTAFERRCYPVGEDAAPAPLQAPFSYVVRYHRPADDEAAFVEDYLASHPPIEARLPGIRAIMCYLPLSRQPDGDRRGARGLLPSADYMIGNEVVFDDDAAFNIAMASPVREELRAHFRALPCFAGANTHYPMLRRRLLG